MVILTVLARRSLPGNYCDLASWEPEVWIREGDRKDKLPEIVRNALDMA